MEHSVSRECLGPGLTPLGTGRLRKRRQTGGSRELPRSQLLAWMNSRALHFSSPCLTTAGDFAPRGPAKTQSLVVLLFIFKALMKALFARG